MQVGSKVEVEMRKMQYRMALKLVASVQEQYDEVLYMTDEDGSYLIPSDMFSTAIKEPTTMVIDYIAKLVVEFEYRTGLSIPVEELPVESLSGLFDGLTSQIEFMLENI